jgi:hypothetical protein
LEPSNTLPPPTSTPRPTTVRADAQGPAPKSMEPKSTAREVEYKKLTNPSAPTRTSDTPNDVPHDGCRFAPTFHERVSSESCKPVARASTANAFLRNSPWTALPELPSTSKRSYSMRPPISPRRPAARAVCTRNSCAWLCAMSIPEALSVKLAGKRMARILSVFASTQVSKAARLPEKISGEPPRLTDESPKAMMSSPAKFVLTVSRSMMVASMRPLNSWSRMRCCEPLVVRDRLRITSPRPFRLAGAWAQPAAGARLSATAVRAHVARSSRCIVVPLIRRTSHAYGRHSGSCHPQPRSRLQLSATRNPV